MVFSSLLSCLLSSVFLLLSSILPSLLPSLLSCLLSSSSLLLLLFCDFITASWHIITHHPSHTNSISTHPSPHCSITSMIDHFTTLPSPNSPSCLCIVELMVPLTSSSILLSVFAVLTVLPEHALQSVYCSSDDHPW